MLSVGGPNLYGRDEIIKMVWDECLGRHRGVPRGLPVLALIGPRGSGKTAILNHLAARCEQRAAQPFVPVLNLERFGQERRGWQIITELAYELASTKWPQFGRMEFPRFTLGRMIVDRSITTDSPEEAQADIEELLKKASKRKEDKPRRVSGLIDLLPELLGLPPVHRVAEYLGANLLRRRPVTRLFRTGLEFYSAALQKPHNNGFSALVELGRLEQEYAGNGPDTVTRVLCEAFLADLTAIYRHGFRPTNCLILLDNVDSAIGHAFLTALVNAKTNRAGADDPLVAVVTSRRVDLPTPLFVGGVSTDYLTLWAEMRTDAQVSFDDWADLHSAWPKSWLYPVRLSDLSLESVQGIESDILPDTTPRLAAFAHRLTSGHPWGVTKVLEACVQLGAKDRVLGEDELRTVLDVTCPTDTEPLGEVAANVLLLDDLGHTPDAIAWSAARDAVAAERILATTAGLQTQVAARCWLVRQDNRTATEAPPALHPWIRRVLLHELARARADEPSWSEVFEELRHGCDDSDRCEHFGDRYYYDIALERFTDAIRYLNARFDEIEVDAWVVEFNQATSAPHEHIEQPNALTEHGARVNELLAAGIPAELPATDPHGERWMTVANMTVARWIWSDPLRDPALTMSPIIANGYRDLARRSPLNQLKLVAEADLYTHVEHF